MANFEKQWLLSDDQWQKIEARIEDRKRKALKAEWIARGGAEAFWEANVGPAGSVAAGEAYLDCYFGEGRWVD